MKFLFFIMMTFGISLMPAMACGPDGSGIVEENDLWIPEDAVGIRSANVTEEDFNRVLDRIEEIYTPIISQKGGTLSVVRNWSKGTVNAYAKRMGQTWEISMYGGLARHPTITVDGFAMVACHEIGHHIGGSPHVDGGWFSVNDWASNEGQADYYASAKCFRRYVEEDDNVAMMKEKEAEIPLRAKIFCQLSHLDSKEDMAICERSAMAGTSLGMLFARLSKKIDVKLHTPIKTKVSKTSHKHPAAQCRLDTYFQGALCYKSYDDSVSNTDPAVGYCSRLNRDHNGVRPRCWYHPGGVAGNAIPAEDFSTGELALAK